MKVSKSLLQAIAVAVVVGAGAVLTLISANLKRKITMVKL